MLIYFELCKQKNKQKILDELQRVGKLRSSSKRIRDWPFLERDSVWEVAGAGSSDASLQPHGYADKAVNSWLWLRWTWLWQTCVEWTCEWKMSIFLSFKQIKFKSISQVHAMVLDIQYMPPFSLYSASTTHEFLSKSTSWNTAPVPYFWCKS